MTVLSIGKLRNDYHGSKTRELIAMKLGSEELYRKPHLNFQICEQLIFVGGEADSELSLFVTSFSFFLSSPHVQFTAVEHTIYQNVSFYAWKCHLGVSMTKAYINILDFGSSA